MHRTSFKSFITPNLWSIIAIALVFTSTIAARSNAAPTLFPSATTTTISYQGTLSNAGGQPVNAATPMTFKLYTAPSGGTALWTEARAGANSVPINNGLFNVLLGSVTPIDVNLLSQDLWLGISVNGDAEMSPREKLGSVPFAAVAGSAQTVPDGSITNQKQTIKTFQALDPSEVSLLGIVLSQQLSQFTFENVPAGDISVVATVVGRLESGSSAGWLTLTANGQGVDSRAGHVLQENYTQITLIGTVENFAGGTLTLRITASTENANARIWYGVTGDVRFQRKVTVIAGQ